MALGTSWTTIDSATISGSYVFLLQARLSSQSQTANTSTIETRISWSFPNEYYSYSSSGTEYYVSGMGDSSSPQYVSYSGESGVCCSSSYTISHNSDGTLTDSISGWISFGGVGTSTGVMSGSFDLPTIKRISSITCNSTSIYPYGNTYTLTITKYVSSYTHTVRYGFGTLSGTIATGVNTSCTWTPDRTMLSVIPNQTSNSNLWIYCDTYNGSTLVGTSRLNLTMRTSAAYSAPEITVATVTETSSGYGITDAQTVQLLSTKSIAVTANTQDYSSLVSIAVTNGAQTVTYSPSSTVTSASTTFTMSNLTTGYYTITVTDGRGYTYSTSVTTTFYEYILPTITSAAIDRPTPTADYGTLTLAGAVYKGTVGSYNNALTVSYTYVESGTSVVNTGSTTITPSYAGDGATTYSVRNLTLSDVFSYQKQYDVTITITDTIGSTATATVHVILGIPVYSWGAEHFDVYGEFHIHDRETLSTALKMSANTVIPNIKFAEVVHNTTYSLSATTTSVTFSLPDDFGTSLGCYLSLAWALSTWSGATVNIVRDYTIESGTGEVILHSESAQNYNISICLLYISDENNY